MGKGAVYHYGIDAEFELVQVGFSNAHAYMVCSDGLVVGLGDNHAIYADNALDVGRQNAVQVALDVHVYANLAVKIFDVHKVVQVGFACSQSEVLEAHVHVEVVGSRIDGDLHIQIATGGELEAYAYVGLLVAQVDGGNSHAKVLDVDLGTHFGVFVDDVAVLESDVLYGYAHGQPFSDFSRVDHGGRIGGGGVDRLGGAGIHGCDFVQDIAEVETVPALYHMHIEPLQVDFAYAYGSRNNPGGVQVDAELLEGHEGRGAVTLQEGEIVYVDGPGQGAKAHVFDGDLPADIFLGVGDDVVLHEFRG